MGEDADLERGAAQKIDSGQGITWMSLCDGMGGAALALDRIKQRVNKYIAVECDIEARKMARCVIAKLDRIDNLEQDWHQDINHITEEDIAKFDATWINRRV